MKLSIVSTLYNSAPYLKEFYTRVKQAATQITNEFEIIFVDDGSPDNSFALAHELHVQDTHVKIVQLSKNFGHHKAMATGLKYAIGEYVFLIDSDLEEPPELLLEFWHQLQRDEAVDVIYGVQNQRKGHWFERWTGGIYYKVLNKLSDELKMTENLSTIRLMKRDYVKALLEFQERSYYFGPISNLVGFNQKQFYFDKASKKISSYTFFKKYHLFLDSILSFSAKPLYFIFYLGTGITISSSIYLIYLLIRHLIWGVSVQGWTSLAVLVSLFGGLNLFFMGIVSVYILHIFQETKQRPFSIVKKFYNSSAIASMKQDYVSAEHKVTGETCS